MYWDSGSIEKKTKRSEVVARSTEDKQFCENS